MIRPSQQARDETSIIRSVLEGDTHLYHELIRPYERSVFVIARSLLKNDADAEDAAQEVFLKAFRKLSSFRGDARFSTWLVSIALNEARGRLRRLSAHPSKSIDQPVEDGGVSPALLRDWREVPSEALERQEINALLQQAIGNLPENYRETFLLRDVEGLDGAETASALGISISNVKVRLHRARTMLQRELAPRLKSIEPKRRRWLPWS